MTHLTEQDLKKYGKTYSLSRRAIALVNQQKALWPLASSNYTALRRIQTCGFQMGSSKLVCQHNPGRIHSSAADPDSMNGPGHACVLCEAHRPPEQAAIQYNGQFSIVCNPFPIFPFHLTIVLNRHEPQTIEGHLGDFLRMVKDLDEFIVFYNGPESGASFPQHLHFQAGIRGILPLEEEIENLPEQHPGLLDDTTDIKIYAVEDSLRRYLYFRAVNKNILESRIHEALSALSGQQTGPEPRINLLGWYSGNSWHTVLFPRTNLRPKEYYADDFDRLLISPASVEMAGLIIMPREEDFFKIRGSDFHSIFDQITISRASFAILKDKLTHKE